MLWVTCSTDLYGSVKAEIHLNHIFIVELFKKKKKKIRNPDIHIHSLTCPLKVTNDHFVTQITGVEAPFVFLPCLLHSDWWNLWLLALIGRTRELNIRKV